VLTEAILLSLLSLTELIGAGETKNFSFSGSYHEREREEREI
jgi:hypothetical protein